MLANIRLRNVLIIVTVTIFSISLIQIFLSVFLGSALPTTGGNTIAVAKTGKFAVTYPQEWHFIDSPKGYLDNPAAILVYPNFLKLGVSVSIYRSSAKLESLDDIAKWGEQIAQRHTSYKSLSLGGLLIKDEETLIREYRWLAPATPIGAAQPILCIDDYRIHLKIGYLLTLCANEEDFDRLKPIFMQVIRSFAYQD